MFVAEVSDGREYELIDGELLYRLYQSHGGAEVT